MRTHFEKILILCITFLTISCSGVKFSEWHFPYMMPVQQGNVITDKEVSQIKIGMTKNDVSYIIGHPLTQFMFNDNRWDFVYQIYKNNDLKKNADLVIFFDKNNKVIQISKSGELPE